MAGIGLPFDSRLGRLIASVGLSAMVLQLMAGPALGQDYADEYVYENAQYGGQSWVAGSCGTLVPCTNSYLSEPNLANISGPCFGTGGSQLFNWNDCISSAHVFQRFVSGYTLEVVFWTNANYGGLVSNTCVVVGISDCYISQVARNDQISSIFGTRYPS